MLFWHFAGDTLRDGSPLPSAGDMSATIENIKPCVHGWHASERAGDALQYAPGCNVALVRLHGATIPHGDPTDKHVGQRRETVIGYVDTSAELIAWARWCALQVIHLWDAPQVVRAWLETGDEGIRDAARDAAVAGARAGAMAAAGNAACRAARAAARTTAWRAARAAAGDAILAASWSASWSASAAAAAAGVAAEAAAKAAQNVDLEPRLRALLGDNK